MAIDCSDMTARLYGEKPGDWQVVSSWWEGRGNHIFAETVLPPLGVLVEKAGEPIAAAWCYESFGIGVAFLEFPCTKPGLSPFVSAAALAKAEATIASVLQQRGRHKLLIGHTRPHIAAAMQRIGYVKAAENLVTVMRRID